MYWKYEYFVYLLLLNSISFTIGRKFDWRRHRRQENDNSIQQNEENIENQQNTENQENESLIEDNPIKESNEEPVEGVLGLGDSEQEKSKELLPGQTLIRPMDAMLQSSATYPKTYVSKSLVYGNPQSINRRPTDLLNTGFRKNNGKVREALRAIIQSVQDIDREGIDMGRSYKVETRRRAKSSSESSDSSSTEQEDNPGNPYTIHKDRYKQNWPWNFEMGDHMNINPNGPEFSQTWGPSATDLFYARKWWYFNQDDYLPFR